MNTVTPECMKSFEVSAGIAAAYLDAVDQRSESVRLDPEYYQACASLLLKLFSLFTAQAFPAVLASSAAARELAENQALTRTLGSGQASLPELRHFSRPNAR